MSAAFETQLYAWLSGQAYVSALVGQDIYPLALPETHGLPAITYHRVSSPVVTTQDRANLNHIRLRVSCWGATFDDANAVKDVVVQALDRPVPFAKSSVLEDDGIDLRDPDTGIIHKVLDFMMLSDV